VSREPSQKGHLTEGELIQSAHLHSSAAYAKRVTERKEVEELSRKIIDIGDQKFGFVSEQMISDRLRKVTISFRGTVSLSDWLVDVNFVEADLKLFLGLRGKCHTGFKDRYLLIREDLKKILSSLELVGGKHEHHICHQHPAGSHSSDIRTVYVFTGHSLGGALACLASLDFKVNFRLHNSYCITFSSPPLL